MTILGDREWYLDWDGVIWKYFSEAQSAFLDCEKVLGTGTCKIGRVVV